MNSDQEKLNSLLNRLADPASQPLTPEETQLLEDFKRRYPFFSMPTPTTEDTPSLNDVVTAPSREALARMKGEKDASRFDNFYPPEKGPATPTTYAAIDDFLNTYGHQSEEEDQLLERLIFNPIPDYAQQLAQEEEESLPAEPTPECDNNSAEARLNRFILNHRHGSPVLPQQAPLADDETKPKATESKPITPTPKAAQATPENQQTTEVQAKKTATPHQRSETLKTAPTDSLLSESLAKIYIKTRRYEQAYEILNGLSLRFPEKSSYFADQLRFLRKLILNEQKIRIENNRESDNNQP